MRKTTSTLLVSVVLSSFGFLAPAEAYTIDTTVSDLDNVQPFGAPNTATYGQIFTVVGSDTHLDSFSLYLRERWSGAGALDLRGYVADWDGTNAISILFESGTQAMNGAGTLQEFSFSPDIDLVSGNSYVAFLSISGLPAQSDSTFRMPFGADSIPGTFVFINSGSDFSLLTQPFWALDWLGQEYGCAGCDAWFKASLSQPVQVPEPSTLALFGAGLAGLTWIVRRQKPA